ncbi:hypothetical protein [Nonomuraea sp. SBT364]|uniref:hypothetical protein n=1 Tax=Nonomuraea sp. SBT364 TaxID=1580530 RepID=UPI00066E3A56|nr:hypothetical protein [Nonomuraea sp. SBT364]
MVIRYRGVVLVRDGFDTHQLWPYECLCCWHVWEVRYTVRRLDDGHGNTVEVWLRNGVTVQPPWAGTCCPGCGAVQVTSFPPGYLSRHPELVSAAEPDPAPAPVEPLPPVTSARAPRPRRLLLGLGVPVLLLAGFELYLVVLAVAHVG